MSDVKKKRKIGITMGDPSGIGAEIIIKALLSPRLSNEIEPVIIGDRDFLSRTSESLDLPLNMSAYERETHNPANVAIVDMRNVPDSLEMGCVSKEAGQASLDYIHRAVEMVLDHELDAIATAPISKLAINAAGCEFAGHTELIAHLSGTGRVAMLLMSGSWRILHLSTHISLAQAISLVTVERLVWTVNLGYRALKSMGIDQPRIAVAGLNPHAGEGGLMGSEELEIIAPAVEEARQGGVDVVGPLPPDTVFARARSGEFDLVVAMYHDQGHVALKTCSFEMGADSTEISGVNMTLGLPLVRTSVDHGVAFDIAGKGVASATSLLDAIDVAVQMCSAGARDRCLDQMNSKEQNK